MKTPASGGSSIPIGPPAFGRLNDIHIHKNGVGPSGKLYEQRHVISYNEAF